jgi:hypothetical protein
MGLLMPLSMPGLRYFPDGFCTGLFLGFLLLLLTLWSGYWSRHKRRQNIDELRKILRR